MKLIMNGYCLLVSDIIFIFIFYGWVTLCWNNEIYLINRLWGTPSIGTIWVYKIQRFTYTYIHIRLIMLCFNVKKNLNRKHMYRYIYDGRGHCYCCSETKTKSFKMIYYLISFGHVCLYYFVLKYYCNDCVKC